MSKILQERYKLFVFVQTLVKLKPKIFDIPLTNYQTPNSYFGNSALPWWRAIQKLAGFKLSQLLNRPVFQKLLGVSSCKVSTLGQRSQNR